MPTSLLLTVSFTLLLLIAIAPFVSFIMMVGFDQRRRLLLPFTWKTWTTFVLIKVALDIVIFLVAGSHYLFTIWVKLEPMQEVAFGIGFVAVIMAFISSRLPAEN